MAGPRCEGGERRMKQRFTGEGRAENSECKTSRFPSGDRTARGLPQPLFHAKGVAILRPAL